MNYDPKYGRGLYAERDIVLNEKTELCGLDYKLSYRNCNQCAVEFSFSLIPCPTCPFFMHCSQECLELNWKLYHRYECCVATKLCSVTSISDMLFVRLFFYGLSQFGDDLQAMMDYCQPRVIDESNPLGLDYTNLDRLKVFKALHNTKPRVGVYYSEDLVKCAAACYYVVFLKNPMVGEILRTAAHHRFFQQSLMQYTRVALALLTSGVIYKDQTANIIRPIGSLLNHSCDPNAIPVSINSGSVKVVLLRPVCKGEQIFITNGPTWWLPEVSKALHFKCQCVVCDQGPRGREWREVIGEQLQPMTRHELRTLQAMVNGGEQKRATLLNAIQQFIKRNWHSHPLGKEFGPVLKLYLNTLRDADDAANIALNRARLQDKFVEH